MTFDEIIKLMENIQRCILDYIENDDNDEKKIQNLEELFNIHNIRNNKYEQILLYHFIVIVANNHYPNESFFEKILIILKLFIKVMTQYFSNCEIFNIFKSNKKLLLFLIEEKIILIDNYILNKFSTDRFLSEKYPNYFLPEIKSFLTNNNSIKNHRYNNLISEAYDLPEDFYEKRKIGQNDGLFCRFIQNDLVKDFIIYVNMNNISIAKTTINLSIYETNSFLLMKKSPTLIEYAAFYGSIQIFRYLLMNNAELSPSLWLYAIHGNNPDIIHLLEDMHITPNLKCLKESFKCFNNEISNYLINNYFFDKRIEYSLCALKCYNFLFVDYKNADMFSMNLWCKYDFPLFVDILIKTNGIDFRYSILKIILLSQINFEIKQFNNILYCNFL